MVVAVVAATALFAIVTVYIDIRRSVYGIAMERPRREQVVWFVL